MRVISLWQPWATLVVFGYKKLETRHWDTDFTGPLLIHAAKKKSGKIHVLCVEQSEIAMALQRCGHTYHSLPRGGIIGKVYLGSTHAVESDFVKRCFRDNPDERAFGDYGAGRYAWYLDNAIIFDEMIPEVGRQGFWNFDENKLPYTLADALLAQEGDD